MILEKMRLRLGYTAMWLLHVGEALSWHQRFVETGSMLEPEILRSELAA